LESWINSHSMFAEDISIAPVLGKNIEDKINGSAEATMLRVEFEAEGSLERAGGLFSARRELRQDFGPITVEIALKVKGRVSPSRETERMRISDAAKGLIGSDFSKAVVEIVKYDDLGEAHREDINYLKDRITRKEWIEVVNEDGKSVRIQSAVEAIKRAAEKRQGDLWG